MSTEERSKRSSAIGTGIGAGGGRFVTMTMDLEIASGIGLVSDDAVYRGW